MAYKLCNPTPFEARIEWSPGVPIIIPADGEVELSHEQGDDFRLDKPGTEGVLEITRPQGVFLLDSNRNYDIQALEALKEAATRKMAEYRRRVESLKKLKSASGIMPDKESLEQIIEDTGLNKLKTDAEACERRAKKIEKVVAGMEETVREPFDPERTVFSLPTGPRQFPSKLSRELFLDENPDIAAKEKAFTEDEEEE
jgi:hypothetical protein